MFEWLAKLPLFRSLKIRRENYSNEQDETGLITEEKWIADFSKPQAVRFDIKAENSHDAYTRENTLVLGLKKSRCLAWVDAPGYSYGDMVLEARFTLDPRGGYTAAGFLFRVMDGGTHYGVLISSKGFFRLDVVRNGMPLPLIGWTEAPVAGTPPGTASLTLIAYGIRFILIINGKWAAEISDAALSAGEICFAAASYEGDVSAGSPYAAGAVLEFLSVDTRFSEVRALYEKWSAAAPDPQSCLRLAETFAAMNQPGPALIQLKRGWNILGRQKTARELLFAGRLALELGHFSEAEEYIAACLGAGEEGPERDGALIEKARLLYATKRFGGLAGHTKEALKLLPGEPLLHNLQGHALKVQGEHTQAAAAFDRAFELDEADGFLAEEAAFLYEALGQKDEALKRCFQAGRAFLAGEDYRALGNLIPKLLSLGETNWEARGLAGKWAFGTEDWNRAEEEFARAEKLRKKLRPRPPRDAASVFLMGLLRIRQGNRREALSLLEEAANLAPDYPLFRFRLAENRFLLSGNPKDPKLAADMKEALQLAPHDGWIRNFAAQLAMNRDSLEEAAEHLEKARSALGDIPPIRVNQAVLASRRGDLPGALAMLDSPEDEDPDGLMANCAGNLLVQAGRYEEAEGCYEKALAAAPDNREYVCNRASCLIELGRYGTADEILDRARRQGPDPAVLELISHIAFKKGEYSRAETVCLAALNLDPCHVPSLLTLARVCLSQNRRNESKEYLRRLEALPLEGQAVLRRQELQEQ